ncbi:exopolysaccharide biosynthesis protein [Pseudoxanthomonas spadix]|jgi:hypothetical protein|nr:exopolysaccharide biosynthesis protein [Pseudoxanthomonas spadix]MBP3973463.1 exopolysaccharide biosynthesis protein [Pseudoxanthomonas spadix]RMW94854.1 exopolysaccharide biosynthesis protein [Pseudoxanthomonas spadix]
MTRSSADPNEPGQPAQSTRSLLEDMARGDPAERLRLVDILADLQQGAFGMLLFIGTLPSFIPIPGLAGGISGPLVMLVGAQLLLGLREPWLPQFIAIRGPARHSVVRFGEVIARPLRWLERMVRPRWPAMLDSRPASAFTGLLLLLLGLLLLLPIPFTNYLFGLLLLIYVFALLERDGMLLLGAWILGLVAIVGFGVSLKELAQVALDWIGRLL